MLSHTQSNHTKIKRMTPQAFIEKWWHNKLSERAGAQQHFLDLCELLGVEKPADPDNYCFERGAKKTGAAHGWADVWKRGAFAWEYKGPGTKLTAALKQLMTYALALDNPPLLFAKLVYKINRNGYEAKCRQVVAGGSKCRKRHQSRAMGRWLWHTVYDRSQKIPREVHTKRPREIIEVHSAKGEKYSQQTKKTYARYIVWHKMSGCKECALHQ